MPAEAPAADGREIMAIGGRALQTHRTVVPRVSSTAALLLLVLVGAGGLSALGLLVAAPSTFPDEAIYAELARHLGATGRFEFLGQGFPALTYGPAYVALLAPIFRFSSSAHDAYLAARSFNALLFATAAIPAFSIALRVVSRRTAFLVAAATIFVPASVYTTKLQTESLAYPLVLWFVLAALRLIERPNLRRQSVLLLCAGVAPLARFELVGLGPALAIGCLVVSQGRLRDRCVRLAPTLVGTVVVSVVLLALLHATSGSAGTAGAHGSDIRSFSLWRFAGLAFSSMAAIDLQAGILPFACLAIATAAVWRRAPWVPSGFREIVVMSLAAGGALTAVGSAYLASIPPAYSPTPPDRYVFYVIPLMFVLFAAWLERGASRDAATVWIATGVSALPVVVAAARVHNDLGNTNGLAFLPWIYLHQARHGIWLAGLAAYCAMCAVIVVRRRSTINTLVRPTVILVAVTFACAFAFVISAGHTLRRLSPPPGWIDLTSSRGAVAVWAGPRHGKSEILWEMVVMNRNLSAVYYTGTTDALGDGRERKVTLRADGVLLDNGVPIAARYVIAPVDTPIVGRVAAQSKGFAIYVVRDPVRLRR